MFFFLDLKRSYAIYMVFIVRIFFDLVLGRKKAKSGSDFRPLGLLVTLQIYNKHKLDVRIFKRGPEIVKKLNCLK